MKQSETEAILDARVCFCSLHSTHISLKYLQPSVDAHTFSSKMAVRQLLFFFSPGWHRGVFAYLIKTGLLFPDTSSKHFTV